MDNYIKQILQIKTVFYSFQDKMEGRRNKAHCQMDSSNIKHNQDNPKLKTKCYLPFLLYSFLLYK